MGKTEGIFLNLKCDCHRVVLVASMCIKLIDLYTNFSTLLPNVTALWIKLMVSPSIAGRILFSIVRTGLINKSLNLVTGSVALMDFITYLVAKIIFYKIQYW